jgi:hypothetical protein
LAVLFARWAVGESYAAAGTLKKSQAGRKNGAGGVVVQAA